MSCLRDIVNKVNFVVMTAEGHHSIHRSRPLLGPLDLLQAMPDKAIALNKSMNRASALIPDGSYVSTYLSGTAVADEDELEGRDRLSHDGYVTWKHERYGRYLENDMYCAREIGNHLIQPRCGLFP